MKKFKYVFIFILSLICLFSISACTVETQNNSTKSNSANQSSSASSLMGTSSSEQTSSSTSQTNTQNTTLSSSTNNSSSSQQPEIKYYDIVIEPSNNGLVTASKNTAQQGEKIYLTCAPDSGYELTSLKVNLQEVAFNQNKGEFDMPSTDVTVTAIFSKIPNAISYLSSENGTISGPSNALEGRVEVTVTPKSGYEISGVLINYNTTSFYANKVEGKTNVYTFDMPSTDVTVTAEYWQADNREYVSHMILGDSYTDKVYWPCFYSDMKILPKPKTIGVGGTQTGHWKLGYNGSFEHFGTQNTNVVNTYNVANFIFHIGVNDVDMHGYANNDDIVTSIKEMLELYHGGYPNSKFYWVSLSLNTKWGGAHNPSYAHNDDYLYINSKMMQYANSQSWLTYIDTRSVMFADGQPNGDWFYDGLHFNTDGYATWSSLILKNLGYDREVLGDFGGSANNYYSSSTWSKDNQGIISNTTLNLAETHMGQKVGEQTIYLKDVYAQDFYAEFEVKVNSVANNDAYPKFGISLKSNGQHAFLYVDAIAGKLKQSTGVTYRMPTVQWDVPDSESPGHITSEDWNWGVGLEKNSIVDYAVGKYLKLAVLKCGSQLYFYVDDVLCNTVTGISAMGEVAVGLTVLNTNISIKESYITMDITSRLNELDTQSSLLMQNSTVATVVGNTVTNSAAAGEIIVMSSADVANKFYYSADFTLTGTFNGEVAGKIGLLLENSAGMLLYYIDAIDTVNSPLGSNLKVGIIYKPTNGVWTYGESKTVVMSYTNGDYVNLAIYKNNRIFYLIVDGACVMQLNSDTLSNMTAISGNVNVGVFSNNLAFKIKDISFATQNKVVNNILKGINFNEPTSYSINYTADNRGQIAVQQSAVYGEKVNVSVSAISGYEVESVVVKMGETETRYGVKNGGFTFLMPQNDVDISAVYFGADSREFVSHLVVGDSYTEQSTCWKDFDSDMKSLTNAKTVGISGQTVTFWLNNLNSGVNISANYNVANFIFHIGVNDLGITDTCTKEVLVSNLKTLFLNYHNAYQNAQIYWVSLSLNTRYNDEHYSDYIYVNQQISDYIKNYDYLHFIDTTEKMSPNNEQNNDWFYDGLHHNIVGYASWSSLILEGLGYKKSSIGEFGSAGAYYSSNTFYCNNRNTVFNKTATVGEQFLWVNGLYAENFYAEMEISVNNIANNDPSPKFGLTLKGEKQQVFFYVDAQNLAGQKVGVANREPKLTTVPSYNPGDKTEFLASSDWTWGEEKTATNAMSYANGAKVKLAVLKQGSTLSFYVNGTLEISVSNLNNTQQEMAVGVTLFNLDVEISNLFIDTNI